MEEKIVIQKLDSEGRGIGYYHNKPIFVFNALKEEVVLVSHIKERSKYATGVSSKIITSSPKRIKPLCPYFGNCGGCDLMHLSYKDQLQYKEEKVRDFLLKKFGDSIKINPIVGTSSQHYRNKVVLKVGESIGFYEKETHEIVPVEECVIASKKINEIISLLHEMELTGISEVLIRVSDKTEESMVALKTKRTDISSIVEKLKTKITTLLTYDAQYQTLFGPGYIHEKIGDKMYKISPDSFFQVNTEGAYALYSLIRSYVGENEKVLDLYCGTGSIGLFVSDKASSIFGVEINPSAVSDAFFNKELNQVTQADFLCLDTSLFEKDLSFFNMAIVDPPRSGLSKETCSYLLHSNLPKIVYVSCDFMTFVRDLEILKEKYSIEEITPVDLFANTHHVETVCLLKKLSK